MSDDRNRFQEFFESSAYVALKNGLYNYRLRKRSVARHLRGASGLILEIGSGLSPMICGSRFVVYSDVSFSALCLLRSAQPSGFHVVADAKQLPFKARGFENIVCSEVLEHITDDDACIHEMERVLTHGGRLVITFPHRRCYFANDDRYVAHYRRYELWEIRQKLESSGFKAVHVEKVLGPLEKITMMAVIGGITVTHQRDGEKSRPIGFRPVPGWLRWGFDFFNRLYSSFVWMDAKMMPQSAASVLLLIARKTVQTGGAGTK